MRITSRMDQIGNQCIEEITLYSVMFGLNFIPLSYEKHRQHFIKVMVKMIKSLSSLQVQPDQKRSKSSTRNFVRYNSNEKHSLPCSNVDPNVLDQQNQRIYALNVPMEYCCCQDCCCCLNDHCRQQQICEQPFWLNNGCREYSIITPPPLFRNTVRNPIETELNIEKRYPFCWKLVQQQYNKPTTSCFPFDIEMDTLQSDSYIDPHRTQQPPEIVVVDEPTTDAEIEVKQSMEADLPSKSDRRHSSIYSLDLLDDENLIDECQSNKFRKLSNSSSRSSSFRRRLSGCFRKQDSHEWPILITIDHDDSNEDENDRHINNTNNNNSNNIDPKRLSWYRRASQIIRGRSSSFSENRESKKQSIDQNKAINYRNNSLGNDDLFRMDRADPLTRLDLRRESNYQNRALNIADLLNDASKRFLTASVNDLIATPKIASRSSSPQKSSYLKPNNQLPFVRSDSNLVSYGSNLRNRSVPQPPQTSPSSSISQRSQRDGPIIGSADALVGRILQEEGLGKYIDPGLIHAAQQELAEACNLTQEEMDRAAHRLLQAEQRARQARQNQ
ncbi:hypothetical protein SSS_01416 [Sarcoptes scabiei]|uniref:Uncharacterized protein n=1 Tax=Sarcoptes scabiei TaxID=52283 RepID=A0A834VH27_SARSC|nr:hypothetical protein SSS_01416 [Sarcoptes scabiei]